MSSICNHNHSKVEPHGGGLGLYLVGFILSIVFTLIPYIVVKDHLLSGVFPIIIVVLSAILQLLVQLIFFLHLSLAPNQRWNLLTFVFTLLILGILVIGSLWIMYNLDYNMMM
ncbi:MAG: cytochrome o ubiquinol oxidase subunit IV [Bacteroidia bacterium]|nr:MAG: cytochrome o ubiquinol oxidase subunit IV [Bacteroidia bacterium]